MADDNFYEFCEKAERAKRKGKGLKFLRYGKNLRCNSEGIYSYGFKTANLDLRNRMIQQKSGYWSPTSNKHYNYAKRMLEQCCDFGETENAPPGGQLERLTPLIHWQNLSYDSHT